MFDSPCRSPAVRSTRGGTRSAASSARASVHCRRPSSSLRSGAMPAFLDVRFSVPESRVRRGRGAGGNESRATPGVLRARHLRLWRAPHLTLLHPPYTLWHLSYVVYREGARTDPSRRWTSGGLARLFSSNSAWVNLRGELNGMSTRDRDPRPDPGAAGSACRIAGAAAIGLAAALRSGLPLLLPFVVFWDVHRRGVQRRALRRPLPLSDLGFANPVGRVSRPDGRTCRRGRNRSAPSLCSP